MVYKFEDIKFSFDNISISSDGQNMSEYFNLPELSDDKKTVLIKPKIDKLLSYMNTKNIETLEFVVSLDVSDIKVTVSDKNYAITETEESSFRFKIRNKTETNKPVKVPGTEVVVSREPFTASTVSSVTQKFPSGLISTEVGTAESTLTKQQVNTDVQGNVEFCFKYTFRSVNTYGAFTLSIAPVDCADNVGNEELFTLFRIQKMDTSKIQPYNLYVVHYDGSGATTLVDSKYIYISDFDTELHTIKINDNSKSEAALKYPIYGEFYFEPEELTVSYNFNGQGYKTVNHSSDGVWKFVLPDGSLNEKSLAIKVTDDLGNEIIKETSFPTAPVIAKIERGPMANNGPTDRGPEFMVTMVGNSKSTGAGVAKKLWDSPIHVNLYGFCSSENDGTISFNLYGPAESKVYVKVIDNNNNSVSASFTKTFYNPPAFIPKNKNTVGSQVEYDLMAACDPDEKWFKQKYKVFYYWPDDDLDDGDDSYWDSYYYNKWAKENSYGESFYDGLKTNEEDGVKYYFYTGTPSSGDATDTLVASSNIPSMYFVKSDQPVIVNTIITKKTYSECRNWTYEKWNHRHVTINDKYFNFSSSDRKTKSYNIDLTEIPYGYCYVVVAHFADGSVRMSEVRQMN